MTPKTPTEVLLDEVVHGMAKDGAGRRELRILQQREHFRTNGTKRTTPRMRVVTDDRDRDMRPLVERFTNTGIDNRKPLVASTHAIGAQGIAGAGYLGVLSTCAQCKRGNRLVGPLAAPAARRVCQPNCDALKGPKSGSKYRRSDGFRIPSMVGSDKAVV